MGGPAASVFLPRPLTPATGDELLRASFRCESKGDYGIRQDGLLFDGWIDERPFVVEFGFEYKRRLDEIDFAGFVTAMGWAPVDEVLCVAMCNREADHRLLGRICVMFAEKSGGAVHLGGWPDNLTMAVAARLPGRVVELPAFTEGRPWPDRSPDVFCDAEFLRAWSQHPQFCMLK